ncbi:MAG: AAA family ATPase, partial [Fibromonadaceae bacterium]|nr:AAA family ATPase [Fibromonadaceae bacterium]
MPKKKPRIDLSSSEFAHYIEKKMVYVDKSMFIEHFMDNPSKVLLITRPRRMGKSLNMNMLAEFLDCKKSSARLFKGLKIEKRKAFKEHLNKYPVIYLTFKNFSPTYYKTTLRAQLIDHINKYLNPKQYTEQVKEIVKNKKNENEINLRILTENLHLALGVKPVILIDEYDRLLMDCLHKPNYEEIRNYLSLVFEFAFKDNPHIEKVFLTGILRISQESMFSKLNNVRVFDVFEPSEFDEDFGLTQKEVKALVEPKDFKIVKKWYDGIRVGDSSVFYIFSVMNFLDRGRVSNYWGQSGTINLLG